jgi:hypothetical protein
MAIFITIWLIAKRNNKTNDLRVFKNILDDLA